MRYLERKKRKLKRMKMKKETSQVSLSKKAFCNTAGESNESVNLEGFHKFLRL